jgi:hypothetical protein
MSPKKSENWVTLLGKKGTVTIESIGEGKRKGSIGFNETEITPPCY